VAAEPTRSRRPVQVVRAATVLVLLALLARISRWSLWADEAFSVSTSNRSWESLAKLTYRSEVTGATYAALLRQWSQVGTSVAWLRGLSVVCVGLSVPLLFGLGRRLANEVAAAIAVVMFCANATVLRYGQHIRFYSFVILIALVVSYCFVREVLADGRSALGWRCAWAIFAVVLVGAHLLATPLLLALALARFVGAEPTRRRMVATVSALVPAGLASGGIALLVTRRDEGQSLVTFHPIRTLSDVAQSTAGTPGVIGTGFVVLGIFALMVVNRGWIVRPENRFSAAIVVSVIVVPTSILYVASFVRPSLLGRYVIYSVPFVCLLVGALTAEAIQSPKSRENSRAQALSAAGVVAIAVGSMFGISRWYRGVEVADWRSLATEVFANSKPTDAIVFANDSNRLFFEYYRPGKGPRSFEVPVPLFPIEPWGGFETGKQQYRVFPPAVIENARDTRTRLWVVVEAGLVPGSFPALDQLRGLPILRERTTSAGFVRLYDVTKIATP
jgi:mannosyltransferase